MRFSVFVLVLSAFLGSLAFADEANVLPNGVARLRLVPSFSSIDKAYDKDGKSVDSGTVGSLFTASGALEFGVTDQVTAGVKWAPGYTVWSDFSTVSPILASVNKKQQLTGPADLEIGAKVQVLGPKGFIPNQQLRFALTPGFSLPLDQYDAKKESENFFAGKDYRPKSSSGHSSPGVAVKADFDYLINEMFLVNLHGQAFQYFPTESVDFGAYVANGLNFLGAWKSAAYNPAAKAASQAYADGIAPLTKTKTTYGTEYSVEFEPHALIPLGGDASFGIGLPVVYEFTAETTRTYNSVDTKADPTNLLTLKPYATCFVLLGPLPVEVQVEYDLPVAGKDELAVGTFVAQVKLFYKFY